jgi:dolichol-phosphate mannosyltransferase
MRESARLFGGMIEWLGFETGFVDVEHVNRFSGESSYKLQALLRLALDGMISFSNRPLYLSIGLGAAVSALSAGYGAYLLAGYILHPYAGVQGWLSTMTVLTFMSGIILLNLGVIGIYVGRIYEQAQGRPLYVIDKVVVSKPVAAAGEEQA